MVMYQIKIKPIEIENIIDTLIKNPYFTTKDNLLSRKAGVHLRKMRKEKKLIIANDRKTGESVLMLRKNPLALEKDVTKTPRKRGRVTYDFEDSWFL